MKGKRKVSDKIEERKKQLLTGEGIVQVEKGKTITSKPGKDNVSAKELSTSYLKAFNDLQGES